jgi:hypothetical protein
MELPPGYDHLIPTPQRDPDNIYRDDGLEEVYDMRSTNQRSQIQNGKSGIYRSWNINGGVTITGSAGSVGYRPQNPSMNKSRTSGSNTPSASSNIPPTAHTLNTNNFMSNIHASTAITSHELPELARTSMDHANATGNNADTGTHEGDQRRESIGLPGITGLMGFGLVHAEDMPLSAVSVTPSSILLPTQPPPLSPSSPEALLFTLPAVESGTECAGNTKDVRRAEEPSTLDPNTSRDER